MDPRCHSTIHLEPAASFPNMTWCFEGERYKVCSKQTHHGSCLVLGGCCFRMLEQRLIYAQWPKEGEAWWVTKFLCLQRDLCTHSASSPPFPTEQPAPYTSRVVRERLCWKRSHQPLFLQEDQECARSALLCFCGRPWAQLQRAPQSKPRRLVIAVQLRRLDTKGLPC